VIHAALLPPVSAHSTSASITGFVGAV
jgi:hypothetical protein